MLPLCFHVQLMEKPTKKAKDVQAQSADRVDATAAKTAGMDSYMLKAKLFSGWSVLPDDRTLIITENGFDLWKCFSCDYDNDLFRLKQIKLKNNLTYHTLFTKSNWRMIIAVIFSNLSNWKEKPEKIKASRGFRTLDLCDTGAMLYQLSYEATHWERGQFIEFISPVRSEMMWSIYEIIHIFELRL